MLTKITFPEYCALEGINASTLKSYAGDYFNPKQVAYNISHRDGAEKSHFTMGRAVHSALEHEGVLPDDEYVKCPYDNYKKKEAQEWKKEQEDKGITPLKLAEYKQASDMAKQIWTNTPKEIQKVIHSVDAQREVSIQVDGYKAMYDLIHGEDLYDYKTTRRTKLKDIVNDAFKLGYHIQAYHYCMVAAAEGLAVNDFYFIFVCTEAPHLVTTMRCTDNFIEAGHNAWQEAMDRYKKYHGIDYRELPSESDGIIELDVPEWALEEEGELEDFE